MNLHEALHYLNFDTTLTRADVDNSPLAELVAEAKLVVADAQVIPEITSNAEMQMFSITSLTMIFGGFYKVQFIGKDIEKVRALDGHLIGAAYLDDDGTVYITSRPRSPNAPRTVTALKNISYSFSVIEADLF